MIGVSFSFKYDLSFTVIELSDHFNDIYIFSRSDLIIFISMTKKWKYP